MDFTKLDYYPDVLDDADNELRDHHYYIERYILPYLQKFVTWDRDTQIIIFKEIESEFVNTLHHLRLIIDLDINKASTQNYFSDERSG